MRIAGWGIAASVVALFACGGERGKSAKLASDTEPSAEDRPASCPATAPAPAPLPGTAAEHRELSYWLERTAVAGLDPDEVLLSPEELASLEASFAVERTGFYPQVDLLAPESTQAVLARVSQRRQWLSEKLSSGEYLTASGSPFQEVLETPDQTPALAREIRVALGDVPFRCAPTDERFSSPDRDEHVDHNRCSTARAQEPILVYGHWSGDWLLARTRFTWGFIREDAPLSPPLSDADAERFVRGPFATITRDGFRAAPDAAPLGAGTRVPFLDGGERIAVATAAGVLASSAAAARPSRRPLTRRAVFTEAFSLLGTPYGLGGTGGGRDCSRLTLDLFESFGLSLPRHSSWQARAGSYRVDVSDMDEETRLTVIDAANERGVVLLHFPGHIMLYLGRNDAGEPMALHALSEYLVPCDGTDLDTHYKVNEITVTDLELGRGSERGAFLERLTDVVVLGKPPGPKLAAIAALRPAVPVAKPAPKACRAAGADRLLVSPARPSAGSPVRVIAAQRQLRPTQLALFDPQGARHVPEAIAVGGPPFGTIATVDEAAPGTWTAVLGDGDDVLACTTFEVSRRAREVDTGPGDGPAWTIRREWSPATEDLYSIFVERLFDYPDLDELTWPNLHSLTKDREHNILIDHLGQSEDEALDLVPDCADLPYTLRAYFAWKLGLPFGFRECGRAREGKPPKCDEGWTNLQPRAELNATGDVDAFQTFVHRGVRRAVHSSSGRTHPADSNTDYYPVPLSREALPPGTLFVDPYGHLLIVADWVGQGKDGRGILIGADAQPDGTVGRRRFWRGSFLFTPGTESGGAGFKAYRPFSVAKDGTLTRPDNRALKKRPRVPFSTEQYAGTADDFYDRLDALINPRPLDALAAQEVIVDALEEAVVRRVVSVDNGEAYMRERGYATMDMPRGPSIFRTTGAWEDYATPSRDWRLLVSIYVTIGFPDRIERSPEQFGVAPERAEAEAQKLREALRTELESRTFSYTRSDGSKQTLSLADIADRRVAFEMAYNPNDCVEIRWAAPEDSDEMATCKRHAPAEQRQRMQEYRGWFSERRRPPM